MTIKSPTEGGQSTPVPAAAQSKSISPWSAFHHKTFTVVWIATLASNIGSWMYSAASGWLMTSLKPDPIMVSMVQVATSLPMFLFALPAGALADIIDRRRFLVIVEILITLISTIFAFLIWGDGVTPKVLLIFTFLAGVGAALEAPAWEAIVPALVPKRDLGAAVVANGVGVNISRAIGPALAGILVAAWGIAAPFWINAVSNVGVVAALVWWRSPQKVARTLPAERFIVPIARPALCEKRSAFARYLNAGCRFLSFRQRLLGAAATGCPELNRRRRRTLWSPPWRYRHRRARRRLYLPWLGHRLGPNRLVAVGTVGTAFIAVAIRFSP